MVKAIFSSEALLNEVGAEHTEINKGVATTIINILFTSKNLYEDAAIDLMKTFLSTGSLDFSKYNLAFGR